MLRQAIVQSRKDLKCPTGMLPHTDHTASRHQRSAKQQGLQPMLLKNLKHGCWRRVAQ